MSGERFTLDTNILVYSTDARDQGKQAIAAEFVRASAEQDCLLALQAIGEFHVVAVRKLKLLAADARTRGLSLMTVFETPSRIRRTPSVRRWQNRQLAASRFGTRCFLPPRPRPAALRSSRKI
jgi:predicted nucleic acid-binding protein